MRGAYRKSGRLQMEQINNNDTRLNFQTYTEVLEEHGIKMNGTKQSEIMSGTVEVKEIRETKKPIN